MAESNPLPSSFNATPKGFFPQVLAFNTNSSLLIERNNFLIGSGSEIWEGIAQAIQYPIENHKKRPSFQLVWDEVFRGWNVFYFY